MTALPGALLLLLLDSRSPAGAHSHSGGMEAAVTSGWVRTPQDVGEFCRGRLRANGLVGAAFTARACLLYQGAGTIRDWTGLDRELSARMPAEAARRASRVLGSGLRRLLVAGAPGSAQDLTRLWAGCPRPAPHQPLVLGAGVALSGGDPLLAARASALQACTGPASAAVRLLGLDPYAVHRVTAELAGTVEQVAVDAVTAATAHAELGTALPALAAPQLDLLADVHTTQEVRLFAS